RSTDSSARRRTRPRAVAAGRTVRRPSALGHGASPDRSRRQCDTAVPENRREATARPRAEFRAWGSGVDGLPAELRLVRRDARVDARLTRFGAAFSPRHDADERVADHQRSSRVALAGVDAALRVARAPARKTAEYGHR